MPERRLANLLGLVKHQASMEYIYLGSSFGRPPPETLPPWDDSDPNAEIWEAFGRAWQDTGLVFTTRSGPPIEPRNPAETTVIRLIFNLYARDRLGARAIANTLNDRGHRTATGGQWSAHQVLRVLSNRIHLGELSSRGITTTGCHPPIIDQTTFDEAQRILRAMP